MNMSKQDKAMWRVSNTRTREGWLDIQDNTSVICQVMDLYGTPLSRDRAALIVRAVNAHDGLVKACERAEEYISQLKTHNWKVRTNLVGDIQHALAQVDNV